jgi:hypothetical protein
MVDDLIESTAKAVQGVATQKVLQEVHNGQPVVKTTKTVTPPSVDSWKEQMMSRFKRK